MCFVKCLRLAEVKEQQFRLFELGITQRDPGRYYDGGFNSFSLLKCTKKSEFIATKNDASRTRRLQDGSAVSAPDGPKFPIVVGSKIIVSFVDSTCGIRVKRKDL